MNGSKHMYAPVKGKKWERQEKRGREVAKKKQEQEIEKRKNGGKTLMVRDFPANGDYVPGVKVSGKWLQRFGFEKGDSVNLRAEEGKIIIELTD